MLRNATMFKKLGIITLMVLFLITFNPVYLFAQEHDDDNHHGHGEHGRNWGLILGAGGGVMPKYNGSDEMEIFPIPFVDAHYRLGYLQFFLNEEKGAGLGVSLGEFTLSAGVNIGEGRKPGDADILKSTPKIENSYRIVGAAELELPVGAVSATLNYYPVTVDYKEANRTDKDYDGLFVELDWEGEMPLTHQILLHIGAGLSWMNEDYAKAYYGVAYPTQKLKAFQAGSGIHDVHSSVQLIYMLNMNLGVALFGEATYLLGDAADSPVTKSEFQPFAGALVFYNF